MIRQAEPEDVGAILGLVRDLARFEGAEHEVTVDEALLRGSLFGPDPSAFAHVVEHDGRVVGVAVWFLNYSVRHGCHGIYLGDLYIRQELRGNGYGHALLSELARIAAQQGYAWVEWEVLESNEPAIEFYQHAGAKRVTGTVYRLSDQELRDLAGG